MAERLTEEQRKSRKRFRDRNYRFRKLTKAQQRVKIAKDVIQQILAGKIIPKHGVGYMILADSKRESLFNHNALLDLKSDVREFIEHDTCNVCGIGGTFIAALKLEDRLSFKDMIHSSDDRAMREYLKNWFSEVQIALIECSFEKNSLYIERILSSKKGSERQRIRELGERARDHGLQYLHPDDRLIAIMRNIIDNDGTFKP